MCIKVYRSIKFDNLCPTLEYACHTQIHVYVRILRWTRHLQVSNLNYNVANTNFHHIFIHCLIVKGGFPVDVSL